MDCLTDFKCLHRMQRKSRRETANILSSFFNKAYVNKKLNAYPGTACDAFLEWNFMVFHKEAKEGKLLFRQRDCSDLSLSERVQHRAPHIQGSGLVELNNSPNASSLFFGPNGFKNVGPKWSYVSDLCTITQQLKALNGCHQLLPH